MSGPSRRFDPSELNDPAQPALSAVEQAEATLAARELEQLSANDLARPTEGFGDRVMAAIELEPAPKLVARRASAVRGGFVAAFLMTIRESWGVASSGGRPMAVRAQAIAFVLLVVLAAGSLGGVTAVGVGGWLSGRDSSPTPSVQPEPSIGPSPILPSPSVEPSPSVSPEPSVSPSPKGTEDPTASPEATETNEVETEEPEGTDDSDSETPDPDDTDDLDETDDNSGRGGGSGSGSDDG